MAEKEEVDLFSGDEVPNEISEDMTAYQVAAFLENKGIPRKFCEVFEGR